MDGPLSQYQRRAGAIVLSAVGVLFLALAGRLVFINTVLSDRLHVRAERQYTGHTVLPARRGDILDRHHRVVAMSRQRPDVFVDAARVDDVEGLSAELAVRLNLAPAAVAQKIKARINSRFVIVAAGVDEETAEAIKELNHPAVGLRDRPVRSYPLGSSLAHVLGFVGRDGHGLEGIELAFDAHLSGRDGRSESIRDVRRRPLLRTDSEASAIPVDGGSVVLTIDAEVQRITEQAVAQSVSRFEAESGIGIVLSPRDGSVLAMALVPSFDPHEGGSTPPALRRNRALTDPIEPGSTFKPFLASGALASGVISKTDMIDCKMGTHLIGGRTIKDEHRHGLLNLKGIITYSSNVGMTFVSERMGPQRMRECIRAFGFGERTGIELPGEAPGVVYPLRMWTRASIPSIAMGYEVQVTPLQLAAAFAALVNDGIRVRPRVVKELLGPDGEVIESFDEPHYLGRATTPEVARYMTRELLSAVVEEGTGWRCKLEDYRVVGKTGTAKLVYQNGRKGYEPGKYLSLFMGAAPLENPEVLALVIIRRPASQQGYFGGVVAAPAVRDILRQVLPYLEVPPDIVNLLADAGMHDKGDRRN